MLETRHDAHVLLASLGAPPRLLLHLQLVGEAADALIAAFERSSLPLDGRLVRLGAAVHDAGKILHPGEMSGPGSEHEPAGQALLLANGVPPEIARCCVTHAQWRGAGVSLEERVVALADKLWKGQRVDELELAVIDEAAARSGVDRWSVFTTLDEAFEEIAGGGADRLQRSRAS